MHFVNDPQFKVPDVLYHGSFKEILEFDPDWCGTHTMDSTESFYFTNNPKVAADYAVQSFKTIYEDNPDNMAAEGYICYPEQYPKDYDEADEFLEELAIKHGRIIHAVIDMQNPIIIECEGAGIQDIRHWLGFENLTKLINWIRDPYYYPCPDEIYCDLLDYYAIPGDEDDEESEFTFPDFDGVIFRNAIDSVGDLSTLMQDVYIVPLSCQIGVQSNNLIENELLTF